MSNHPFSNQDADRSHERAPALRELMLGTRGSQLALWQAHAVAARIAEAGGPACCIVTIKTSGDRLQEAPLSEVGGKRLFVKEIEEALLRGEIDLAVHSSKDMPAVLPDGLTIAAVLPREDPLDAIVLPMSNRTDQSSDVVPAFPASPGFGEATPKGSSNAETGSRTVNGMTMENLIAALGQKPVIGTSSVRRAAQLARLIPGARFAPIRGNLDTRLRKLDHGGYDAIVLAAAGLRRLGFASRISFTLPSTACVPAPGQGIVAIEVRHDSQAVRRVAALINDQTSAAALEAERAVVQALGGGCQTPVGVLASAVGENLDLIATVVSVKGERALHRRARGPLGEAAALGARVGRQLIEDGADEILAEAGRVHGLVEGIQP
ncbi:MAG: hydroxymethylbilane synthase [Blastocatellia bacterium]|nr:MAG: hydroxymethylbilane synthase [Blastocatellia bacterium]